jgi:hypothetical protein
MYAYRLQQQKTIDPQRDDINLIINMIKEEFAQC